MKNHNQYSDSVSQWKYTQSNCSNKTEAKATHTHIKKNQQRKKKSRDAHNKIPNNSLLFCSMKCVQYTEIEHLCMCDGESMSMSVWRMHCNFNML